MSIYDAVITGGGPAGCAAAILLAGRGLRVLLLEQKRYPAHKLCGEFLSGEAAGALARLGALDTVRDSGAQAIERAVLVDCEADSFASDLPAPALGISRYQLDSILWHRAKEAGAECREGVSVRAIEGDFEHGFTVATGDGEFRGRLALAAHGKRARLDQALKRPEANHRSPYVAFKAHFHGDVKLNAIEMYAFPGGYCGISPVEGGLANVCWIAHEKTLAEADARVEGMLRGALTQNPALAARLAEMEPADRFKGVSNVVLGAKGTFAGDIALIGDAAGMIAPLCGDGMAMALRSAEIIAPLAGSFLAGEIEGEAFRSYYSRAWRQEFGLRLAIGQVAHPTSFSPPLAHAALGLLRAAPAVGRWLIRKTRG